MKKFNILEYNYKISFATPDKPCSLIIIDSLNNLAYTLYGNPSLVNSTDILETIIDKYYKNQYLYLIGYTTNYNINLQNKSYYQVEKRLVCTKVDDIRTELPEFISYTFNTDYDIRLVVSNNLITKDLIQKANEYELLSYTVDLRKQGISLLQDSSHIFGNRLLNFTRNVDHALRSEDFILISKHRDHIKFKIKDYLVAYAFDYNYTQSSHNDAYEVLDFYKLDFTHMLNIDTQ